MVGGGDFVDARKLLGTWQRVEVVLGKVGQPVVVQVGSGGAAIVAVAGGPWSGLVLAEVRQAILKLGVCGNVAAAGARLGLRVAEAKTADDDDKDENDHYEDARDNACYNVH